MLCLARRALLLIWYIQWECILEQHLKPLCTHRYRSYWEHRLWIGDPKLLQEVFQAEREGLVEKPNFPPFHKVCAPMLRSLLPSRDEPAWRSHYLHQDLHAVLRWMGRCSCQCTS